MSMLSCRKPYTHVHTYISIQCKTVTINNLADNNRPPDLQLNADANRQPVRHNVQCDLHQSSRCRNTYCYRWQEWDLLALQFLPHCTMWHKAQFPQAFGLRKTQVIYEVVINWPRAVIWTWRNQSQQCLKRAVNICFIKSSSSSDM